MSHEATSLEVYVTRHGNVGKRGLRAIADPRWDVDDPRLLPQGRRQAEHTGRRLAELGLPKPPFTRIVSSPLWRTLETAQLIAEVLELRIQAEPGIMEFCHPKMIPSFRGLNDQEAALIFDRLENAAILRERWWPAEPETPETCRARVGRALDRLVPLWRAEGLRCVLLVGHGASTDAAVAHLAGLERCPSGHDNCGISKVTLTPDAAVGALDFVNCTRHLTPEPSAAYTYGA